MQQTSPKWDDRRSVVSLLFCRLIKAAKLQVLLRGMGFDVELTPAYATGNDFWKPPETVTNAGPSKGFWKRTSFRNHNCGCFKEYVYIICVIIDAYSLYQSMLQVLSGYLRSCHVDKLPQGLFDRVCFPADMKNEGTVLGHQFPVLKTI